MRGSRIKSAFSAFAIMWLASSSAWSQHVVYDNSSPQPGPQTGPIYSIDDAHGQQRGSNFFFSFSQFNLVQGEQAIFSGPTNVKNVISRVTGGGESSIDGT